MPYPFYSMHKIFLEPDPKAYVRLITDNHRPLSEPTTAAQRWWREPLLMGDTVEEVWFEVIV